MKKLLTKVRYFLWGKSIQKSMEMAEYAGREAAKSHWLEEVEKRDNKIKELRGNIEEKAQSRLSELTFSVDPKEVMTAISDRSGNAAIIKLGDDELTKQEVKNLKEEVKYYKQSRLYSIFHNTLKNKAQDVMFTKSSSFEDMRSGKMCLLNLDIQDNILKAIETFDIKSK